MREKKRGKIMTQLMINKLQKRGKRKRTKTKRLSKKKRKGKKD